MIKTSAGTGILAQYFPMLPKREELLQTIAGRPELMDVFQQWNEQQQTTFLDYCTGIKSMKILYDGIFKEIFNPEVTPERLERLLSLLLGRTVHIKTVLPNDSVRLGAESSLLYTDIIVELEDGSLSDIEIQKIGYKFPGERAACYSADHLLRQYKRIRGEQGKRFHYQSIKNVYTIVFFEISPKVFLEFSQHYLHHFCQTSDTGLRLDLLQEYIFINLDIFQKNIQNKDIENELEAWLSFLSFDDPERIVDLITCYPQFKTMYQDVYDICQNTEEVMRMYSKELAELDRNTVKLMMDEMQAEIDQQKTQIKSQTAQIESQTAQIEALKKELLNYKNSTL